MCSWFEQIAEVGGIAGQCLAKAGSAGRAGDGRRSGSVKTVALDGAAGISGPGNSSRNGSNISRLRKGSLRGVATESVRGRFATFDLGRKRRGEGAPLGEPGITGSSGPSGAGLLGDRGPSMRSAEAGGSSSNEAPLDHASVKVSAGRSAWKPAPGRKPMERVIRGSSDPQGARVVSRLQMLGRRTFPAGQSEPKGERRHAGSA